MRIIYNNKIKKILINLLIFFMLFNFLYPNIVIASAAVVSGNTVTGSIQGIIDSFRTTTQLGHQTLADLIGMGKKEQGINSVDTAVKNKVKEKFSSLTDAELDKVYKDNVNDKEKIKVKVTLGGSDYAGRFLHKCY